MPATVASISLFTGKDVNLPVYAGAAPTKQSLVWTKNYRVFKAKNVKLSMLASIGQNICVAVLKYLL